MLSRSTALLALAAIVVTPDVAHAAGFDPDQATEAYLATVWGPARAKSDAYFEGGYVLDAIAAGLNILAPLLVLMTGRSRALRDFAERRVGWRWLQVMIYTAVLLLVLTIITLPFDFYRGYLREHEYGMSNQDIPGWARDYAIEAIISTVALAVFAPMIYAVIRNAPKTWWVWGAGLSIVFMAFIITIGPVFIAPLFNTYKPMVEGPLKEQILSLARANGIPATDVYQFDASKQTKRISANVSGMLGTTRISLNDNLLTRATPAEVKAVMAHEMGHYVLNHVYKLLIMFAVFFAVIFAIVGMLFRGTLHAVGSSFGLRDQADPAAMPILIALFVLVFYVATPVYNTMIRVQESEADIFGLNAAREPDGFATIALKLAEYRKLEPSPWEEIVFYDHPSGRSRISMAMHWKAEHLDEFAPTDVSPVSTETPQ